MSEKPRLHLASRRRKGHTVVTATGTIAQDTLIQLRTLLLQALARHERSLLLDLSGVDRIDEAGLDALRRTAARARLVGGQLRLVAPSPPVAERLRSSDLRHRVPVDATLAGALDTSAAPPVPGPEDPPPDWLEQHQPVDAVELDDAWDVGDGPALEAELPLDADPADLVDQHLPVPLDEEEYRTGT